MRSRPGIHLPNIGFNIVQLSARRALTMYTSWSKLQVCQQAAHLYED